MQTLFESKKHSFLVYRKASLVIAPSKQSCGVLCHKVDGAGALDGGNKTGATSNCGIGEHLLPVRLIIAVIVLQSNDKIYSCNESLKFPTLLSGKLHWKLSLRFSFITGTHLLHNMIPVILKRHPNLFHLQEAK